MSHSQTHTQPTYNRYEKARILGARALQISYGAPVLVDTEQSEPILVRSRSNRRIAENDADNERFTASYS
jgi:DNA-directed RNA polymerase subunit K